MHTQSIVLNSDYVTCKALKKIKSTVRLDERISLWNMCISSIYVYIYIALKSMVNLVHPTGVTDESYDQSGLSKWEAESRGPIESK